MVIDLTKCAEGPLHVERQLELVTRFTAYQELESLDDVAVALDVTAGSDRKYLVRGSFRADAQPVCARCLEPFPMVMEGRFDLTYLPEEWRTLDAPVDTGPSDDKNRVAYYSGNSLELVPLVEEQLHLSFPMRFLCAPTCRGLCAQCGTNKNRHNCRCPEPVAESPFGALKQLLD